MCTSFSSYSGLRLGVSLLEKKANFGDVQIAKEISTQDLPDRCLISLSKYKFWLQKWTEEDDLARLIYRL